MLERIKSGLKSGLGIGHKENIETATLIYQHPRLAHRIVIVFGLFALIFSALVGNAASGILGFVIVLLGLGDRNVYRAVRELGIPKRFYAKLYNVTTEEIDVECRRVEKWRKSKKRFGVF